MRSVSLILAAALVAATCTGCSGNGGGQSAFYHNNREHAKWVKNSSSTPKYRNPNTGGPLFY